MGNPLGLLFYIVVETTQGKTYISDTQNIRDYVNIVFSNSNNIPLDGCWDKLQHKIDDMSWFKRESQQIHITINGNLKYFNPDHVVTIELVRC